MILIDIINLYSNIISDYGLEPFNEVIVTYTVLLGFIICTKVIKGLSK